MVGRCRVFFEDRGFGFIEYSTDGEIFDSSIFFSDTLSVQQGDFVEFEIEQDWQGRTKAVDIQRVPRDSAPTLARVLQGRVGEVRSGKSARIDYANDDGRTKQIWFSFGELRPASDGSIYEPVPGCIVEFCIAIRRNHRTAANVTIAEWPVHQQTIEEYFAEAEELPIDFPAPVTEPQSVLAPETKNLSLIEIIRQRRKDPLGPSPGVPGSSSIKLNSKRF